MHDLKGLSISDGTMTLTNLRINWFSSRFNNLIIGYNTILSVAIRPAIPEDDNIRAGKSHSANCLTIFVLAEDEEARYMFAFSEKSEDEEILKSLFETLNNSIKAYQATSYYRDVRVRTLLIPRSGQPLQTMPREVIFERIKNVWHIADGEGHVGQLYLTNFRFIWLSSVNDYFNCSVPLMQIIGVTTFDTKYGRALVIQLSEYAGNLRLGFRIDPQDMIETVSKQLIAYHAMFMKNPFYGIEMAGRMDPAAEDDTGDNMDQTGVDEEEAEMNDADEAFVRGREERRAEALLMVKSVAGTGKGEEEEDESIVYDSEIGLAIQKLPENVTSLRQLFHLQVQ